MWDRGKFLKMNRYFVITLVVFLTTAIPLTQSYRKTSHTVKSTNHKDIYRFACIYSGSSDYYKYSLKQGLEKASEKLGVWVNFLSFKSIETDKHCDEFDKAIAAKVDGIITNIPDADAIGRYIEIADENHIPVITIENDLPGSKRISFIGTNSYAFGVNAGRLMISATNGKARTAMFLSSNMSRQNLKNQGFQDTVMNNDEMDVELFVSEEPSIIGYVNTAQSIFVNNPDRDSFFCHDSESTLGVVRAMIEFNKTNNVVIGSGDSNEILRYIKNGIIYASLVEDPYTIGYLSVENMLKHKKGESISESVNPDIIILSKDNIDSILEEREGKE